MRCGKLVWIRSSLPSRLTMVYMRLLWFSQKCVICKIAMRKSGDQTTSSGPDGVLLGYSVSENSNSICLQTLTAGRMEPWAVGILGFLTAYPILA